MRLLALAVAILGLAACGGETQETITPNENVLNLRVQGLKFVGPSEIESGWTTIRIDNTGGMTHHALVYRLPDGITPEMLDGQVVRPTRASLTATIEGDPQKAAAIAATIPAWVGELV